ncbi:InlB B-repeat-containing protein [Raoultibacter timonensis]|uniref:InlB B-repeat-containing protein n=1 Tax=Raoultibacter timonensis TaxID=1907662 RepID=UPI0026DD9976|nr:InlB B-repeat-containing protein [Raoultibacter timonensis]
MPTIKRPPKLLLIALAAMLAFWGVSGGSALASTDAPAAPNPSATEEAALGEQAEGEPGEAEDDTTENPSGETALDPEQAPPADSAPGIDAEGLAGTAEANSNEATALAADEDQTGTEAELRAEPISVTNQTELQDAMWDIPVGTAGTIELQNSFTISGTIDAPFNRVVTLTSKDGNTFTITQATANARHFKVDGSSSTYNMSLILENVVLDGGTVGGGVLVDGKRGTLTLKAGGTIQNCTSNVAGGAVRVNRGALVIEGGTVSNNKSTISDRSVGGGGIYVTDGSLTMSSGLVGSNTAGNGGGINLVSSSTFTMTGGTISNNTSTVNQGGGVLVAGGSSFTMSGESLIEKNESDRGAGVNVLQDGSSFTMNSGTIRANIAGIHGGGVLVNGAGSFIMNGGVIGGDSAADANTAESGGGVCLYADWSGRDITFTMTGESLIKNNTAEQGGGLNRYNTASATIEMRDNATITENHADVGGGVYTSGGTKTTFDMYGKSSIHHNTAVRSGGGVDSISTEFTMHDQTSIRHNTAGGWGGGIACWSNELFTMNDESSVHHNATTSSGGGVSVSNRAGMVMNDQATVVDNTAAENGGGIFTEYSAATTTNPSSLVMNGGTVARNTALGSVKGGGGIFFDGQSDRSVTLTIGGDAVIVDNAAPNGHGGGIYSNEPYWGQMVIGSDTVFERNTASAAYIPPTTVFDDYPSIEFASISIGGLVPYHPLNNYDINFTGGTPTNVYRVTYYGNGNDGGEAPPSQLYAAGVTVTVSDEGTLTLTDHDFLGWNTSSTATDAEYEATDTFPMPARDVDLYAVWKATPPTLYTVTYHGNGHSAGDAPASSQHAAGDTVTVSGKNTLVRDGYEFVGWHTDPASATALYGPGGTFPMPANDVDLYAIWKAIDPSGPQDPDPKDPEKPGSDPSGKTPTSSKTGSYAKMARTGDEMSILPFAAAACASLLVGGGAYAMVRRRNH